MPVALVAALTQPAEAPAQTATPMVEVGHHRGRRLHAPRLCTQESGRSR
jgi:hypothetical protein